MKCCAICGAPESPRNRIEAAHLTAKGMGGRGEKAPADAHDTALLCAGTGGNTDARSCHGANEAGVLVLDRDPHGALMFCVTASTRSDDSGRVADATARRLKVHRGQWHAALHEDRDWDAVDEVPTYENLPAREDSAAENLPGSDDFLAAIVTQSRELAGTEATAHYYRCCLLARAHAHLTALHGKKQGAALYRDFRTEQLEVGESEASKMLTIGTYLADSPEPVHALGKDALYLLARCIKRGDDRESVTADALAMTAYDFRATHFGKEEPTEPTPRRQCPYQLRCPHPEEVP